MHLPEEIRFSKLTAGGNDFVCLDNTGGAFAALLRSPHLPEFVRRVCRRGLGVGADGVVVASRSPTDATDIQARFFEPDGSEAELCGNGTACFTFWAADKGLLANRRARIHTAAGTARGRVDSFEKDRVHVCIPDPHGLAMDLAVEAKGRPWVVHYIDTGVPHVVTFVEGLDRLDVAHWGPGLRHHPRFQPRGVNANFVQVLDVGHLAMRTFEFGVEAETLACGTGAAASAIVSTLRLNWPEAYRRGEEATDVQVRGGETLAVRFIGDADCGITSVCLATRIRAIYDGRFRDEFMAELRRLDAG